MKNKLANINSNNGRFIDGNPNTGTLGTIVTAEWLNGVQDRMQDVYEELRNVLLLGNLQPDGQRQNQVAEAIKAYCNNINLKVQSNTRNFDNYIPNSKKSNAINSNSADTVATSNAVKAAYDKGVEAKNIAEKAYKVDSTNQNKNLNGLLGQNTVFGIAGRNANVTGLGNIYNYGSGIAFSASSGNAMLYIPHSHKTVNHGVWVQSTFAGNNAEPVWRRIDGADFADIRDNPLTETGNTLKYRKRYIGVQVDSGAYGGLDITRSDSNGSWSSRFEALPDRKWKFWTNSDGKGFEQYLPAKNGTIILDVDADRDATPNQLVRRDGSGDVNGRLFRSTYQNQNTMSGAIAFRINNTGDNYTRYCDNPAAVRTWLGVDVIYQKIGNFEVRKYPDGTMIQTHVYEINDLTNWAERTFSWAVAFVASPLLFEKITTSATTDTIASANILSKSNATSVSYIFYERHAINQGKCRVQFLAIGRWK
ncbi:tail fiber protein [Actinobacillus equuli]|uniref:Phage tail fibre repeat n=1 Tax=Actinobacillus equuli TaxID=718 RepID=A0AAX3FLP6_ACTEU|nr:tail fiber protein [Actinobacillus equuli]WGE45005.1 phage tail protein [Actinobacillus equuli subsp. equuli]VEE92970.1 Phage tail fibre repeat [Actinobacillus equuli]